MTFLISRVDVVPDCCAEEGAEPELHVLNLIHVPTITSSYELWGVTKRMMSQIQANQADFLSQGLGSHLSATHIDHIALNRII